MLADRSHLLSLCLGVLLLTSPTTTRAAGPTLAFDFGALAECEDVTPSSKHEARPEEKIVELNFRVSVHLLAGDIGSVEEVRVEIRDCDSRIRVDSFAPLTRLESQLSDDIQWSRTVEKGGTLGISLGGEAPVPLGDVVAHVTPSASGGVSEREVITERQTRFAPKQAVVASGTIAQEHGVFYKLRQSPQSTLEGVHELTVRFRVPAAWRGDSLRVCCHATGHEKFLWMKQPVTWAQTCAPVAVYLAGDQAARQAALQHVASADSHNH